MVLFTEWCGRLDRAVIETIGTLLLSGTYGTTWQCACPSLTGTEDARTPVEMRISLKMSEHASFYTGAQATSGLTIDVNFGFAMSVRSIDFRSHLIDWTHATFSHDVLSDDIKQTLVMGLVVSY